MTRTFGAPAGAEGSGGHHAVDSRHVAPMTPPNSSMAAQSGSIGRHTSRSRPKVVDSLRSGVTGGTRTKRRKPGMAARPHSLPWTRSVEVLEILDEPVVLPSVCPDCGGSGYLDSINVARETKLQSCKDCGTRWESRID